MAQSDHPHKHANAKDLYETFSHFRADQVGRIAYNWPYPQGLYARAARLFYYSDKFDGKWREYYHLHGEEALFGTNQTTYPAIIVQQQEARFPFNRQFLPPESGELAFLGYFLSLDYFAQDIERDPVDHIDYQDRRYKEKGDTSNLPLLLGDPHRRLLVIAPRDGSCAVLLWSPILKVTKYGIEN